MSKPDKHGMMDLHKVDGVLFRSLEQVAKMTIPSAHCIVIAHRGAGAWIAPRMEPGSYEVDVAAIRPGLTPEDVFPMLVFVVPEAHSFAWAALKPEAVDAMIDEAEGVKRTLN